MPKRKKGQRKKYDKDGSPYHQHGLYQANRVLQLRGLEALDPASPLYQAVQDWQQDVVQQLGGKREVSPIQEQLIRRASITWVLLESIDAWLLRQKTIVAWRRRSLYPMVLQRTQLYKDYREALGQLGLHRVVKRKSLAEHVAIERVQPLSFSGA